MAVQAQYRSNVLLLNRNAQEGKNTVANDYSLLQQTGGGAASSLFDHQPYMQFKSIVGNNNTRKRSRELISPLNTSGTLMALQQSQNQNQILDLSQLHTPQIYPNNGVSTGLHLAFGDQLHHQTQQHQLSLLPSQSSQKALPFLPFLSEDLASHIKQQRKEIESFITFQGEQLREATAEKRRRNFKTLLIAAEDSISRKLIEKEAELKKAFILNSELESRAAQLMTEVQSWQAQAREQEAIAVALQAEINHAMHRNCGSGGLVEDEESVYVDSGRVSELNGPICKACGKRVASVVLLPCRHLCLCRECDIGARCCPLCYSFRSESVEVLMG